jgi:hypothetical protein
MLTNDEGETKLIIERRKHSIIPCADAPKQPLTVCTHLMEDQLIQVGLWIKLLGIYYPLLMLGNTWKSLLIQSGNQSRYLWDHKDTGKLETNMIRAAVKHVNLERIRIIKDTVI